MYRGIPTEQEIEILARRIWPKFPKDRPFCFDSLEYEMAEWMVHNNVQGEIPSLIGRWVQGQFLDVSPDKTQFRFKERALECLETWEEENRLWNSGDNMPMPLNRRLVAGQTARNVRKIKDVIGNSTVTGIHDPYIDAVSLETILKLADLGTEFSPSLQVLRTPLAEPTKRASLTSFLRDVNNERKSHWEIRTYTEPSRPHRRFLVLNDGSILTCGMSLNRIDKNEVLDREPSRSEIAQFDRHFFNEKWKVALPL